MLFNYSYELKKTKGIGLLDGEIKKIGSNSKKSKIKTSPHRL